MLSKDDHSPSGKPTSELMWVTSSEPQMLVRVIVAWASYTAVGERRL